MSATSTNEKAMAAGRAAAFRAVFNRVITNAGVDTSTATTRKPLRMRVRHSLNTALASAFLLVSIRHLIKPCRPGVCGAFWELIRDLDCLLLVPFRLALVFRPCAGVRSTAINVCAAGACCFNYTLGARERQYSPSSASLGCGSLPIRGPFPGTLAGL